VAFNPPTNGEAFEFPFALESYASPGTFQVNPTLAAGDVTIVKDFGTGTPANIATLPTVLNASWPTIKVALSATEMTADTVAILFKDQTAPPEWAEILVSIPTTA